MLTVSVATKVMEFPTRHHDELLALEAKNHSLQLLVAELLLTNQNLRAEAAQLRSRALTALATHPQQPQDR